MNHEEINMENIEEWLKDISDSETKSLIYIIVLVDII